MRTFDLVVMGGGAAGVMAAGMAAARGLRVLVCEKMEKPQRKVRITGKGRCNLTNMRPEADFLTKVRSGAEFFAPSFAQFDNRQTVAFFESIGVPLTVERGERVFPTSGKAWDVAQAHVRWCQSQGAEVACFTQVTDVAVKNGAVCGVTIQTKGPADGVSDGASAPPTEQIQTSRVLITTGGLSYPATGSTGEGYLLAHRLGHRIVEVRPSLTPLVCERAHRKPLAGLLLKNTRVSLLIDDEGVAEEFGDLEFTPFGVSGPVVLRLSRLAVDGLIDGRRVGLSVDLKPALSNAQLLARIERERVAMTARATILNLMSKLLPSALIPLFLERLNLRPDMDLEALTTHRTQVLVTQLKAFPLSLTDYRPFEEAIVTAGGVDTTQVDPLTMQSLLVKGLYFAGEVLDIDADTGGYNLQIAYSTGHQAGQSM